jgi:hypothetical protein
LSLRRWQVNSHTFTLPEVELVPQLDSSGQNVHLNTSEQLPTSDQNEQKLAVSTRVWRIVQVIPILELLAGRLHARMEETRQVMVKLPILVSTRVMLRTTCPQHRPRRSLTNVINAR